MSRISAVQVGQGRIDPVEVPGWGIDADPSNEPTYPMRRRTGAEHEGFSWERPFQQPVSVEVLHSNERPNVAAVFGTASPPSGLSGLLRRLAFKYSESSYGHWLPLMLADRVNQVEGVVQDLAKGRVPNVFAELGWRARWKHDRPRLVTHVVVMAVVIGATVALFGPRRAKDRRASTSRS